MEKQKTKTLCKKSISLLLALLLVLSAIPLGGLTAFAATSGDFEYNVLSEEDKTCEITKYTGSASELNIPSVLSGYQVKEIGRAAFENCASLISVNISHGVTNIKPDAFQGCTALENINIPNSVTTIDDNAFEECTSLTSVTIPDSVIEIAPYAFECCSNLTEIIVSPENTSYCSVDGVLFNKDKTDLLRYPAAKANRNYVIPNSVTNIGKGAFFDNDILECLTVSENVKNIAVDYSSMWYPLHEEHPGAFYNNTSLKKIIWNAEKCYLVYEEKHLDPESPDYDPSYAICNLASFFPECTEFVIGDTVKYIPCLVLANNQNIKSITIPDNVINVNGCAFYNCKNLKSITIGNGVTNIGFSAFEDCTSLTDVTIGNSVTDIGYETFYGCQNLNDVYYSGTQEEWEKISIGESNYSLTSAHIHYNTTENHYEFVETVNATCTEDGYNKYVCPCGYEKREVIPALGHIGEIVETIPPTCTSDGYTKHICSVCGEEYKTDWVWAAGHTKGEIVEVVPPTCTSEGYTKYRCSVCGEEFCTDWTYEEHNYSVLLESHEPTCTEQGYAVYRCETCEDTIFTYTAFALGHEFNNDICTRCGMHKTDCLESSHPYANNTDETWVLNKPGAQSVAVTFSSDTSVESGWDYIYIYDANDVLIGKYTGNELASKQIVVLGDTVKIRLTSDSSGTGFGFALSNVEINKTQSVESDEITVTEGKIGDFSADTKLKVENLEAEDGQIKYDITLMQGEIPIRPAAPVTVKIPVPATMDGADCKVYRQEADGTYTDMQAIYQDGYMVFTTDHFSIYVLTVKDPNAPAITMGDINGDGVINAVDARWALQSASGVRTLSDEQFAAADVNGDGKITAVDARWILQAASGVRVL